MLYIKHGDIVIGTEAEDFASPFASSLTWTRRLLKHGSKSFSLNNFIAQEISLVLHDYLIENLTEDIEIKIENSPRISVVNISFGEVRSSSLCLLSARFLIFQLNNIVICSGSVIRHTLCQKNLPVQKI